MDFLMFQVRSALLGNVKLDRFYRDGEEEAEQKIRRYYSDLIETNKLVIGKFETKSGDQVEFRLVGGILMQKE